jgi:hypothetical protein
MRLLMPPLTGAPLSTEFTPYSQKCCTKQQICRKTGAQTLKIHSEFIASW